MLRILLFTSIFCCSLYSLAQYQPHAGIVPSHTVGAQWLTSSNPSLCSRAFDGNRSTHWQSGAALPYGYLQVAQQNALLGSSSDFGTDGLLSTSVQLPTSSTHVFPFPNQAVMRINLKAGFRDSLTIRLILPDGSRQPLATLSSTYRYKYTPLPIPATQAIGVELETYNPTKLYEVGALSAHASEHIGYVRPDLHEVQQIWLRSWPGQTSVRQSRLEGTVDGTTWLSLKQLDPTVQHGYTVVLDTPRQLRGVRVLHELEPADWKKVSCWELQTYDRYGPHGPLPQTLDTAIALGEMLGVNGIWGWGHQRFSDDLGPTEGPGRMAQWVSNARNYHNLDWDISEPGARPDYVNMAAGGGTEAKHWVNWDREYDAWRAAGLQVNPSVKLVNFAPNRWSNARQETALWAADFAAHFEGFATVEVGNEPWTYPAPLYKSILKGAVFGFRQNQAAFAILPCALQAADSTVESTSKGKNYLGYRLDDTLCQTLDGLNTHLYAFRRDEDGVRRAYPPEFPGTGFGELYNLLRWRAVNAPQLPIYLTEFGYDSPGGGQGCAHAECIGEAEASAYTLRTILLANRMGVRRADYYFYGNTAASGLFTRSGLLSTKAAGRKPKDVVRVLELLQERLAGYRVHKVVQEQVDGYIYQLKNANGQELVVAWLPSVLNTSSAAHSYLQSRIKWFDFSPTDSIPTGSLGAWPSVYR